MKGKKKMRFIVEVQRSEGARRESLGEVRPVFGKCAPQRLHLVIFTFNEYNNNNNIEFGFWGL